TRLLPGSGGAVQFSEPRYCVWVPEDAPPALTVARVVAQHKEGVKIRYSITAGNKDGLFTIDPRSGLITLAASLDYELQPMHELIVAATGDGKRVHSIVQVTVQDVNDNPPEFLESDLQVSLVEEESSHLPATIVKVEARDIDSVDDGRLLYSIGGDGVDGYSEQEAFFTINRHTGDLIQLKALDRDPPRGRGIWQVKVQVRDGQRVPAVLTKTLRRQPRDILDNESSPKTLHHHHLPAPSSSINFPPKIPKKSLKLSEFHHPKKELAEEHFRSSFADSAASEVLLQKNDPENYDVQFEHSKHTKEQNNYILNYYDNKQKTSISENFTPNITGQPTTSVNSVQSETKIPRTLRDSEYRDINPLNDKNNRQFTKSKLKERDRNIQNIYNPKDTEDYKTIFRVSQNTEIRGHKSQQKSPQNIIQFLSHCKGCEIRGIRVSTMENQVSKELEPQHISTLAGNELLEDRKEVQTTLPPQGTLYETSFYDSVGEETTASRLQSRTEDDETHHVFLHYNDADSYYFPDDAGREESIAHEENLHHNPNTDNEKISHFSNDATEIDSLDQIGSPEQNLNNMEDIHYPLSFSYDELFNEYESLGLSDISIDLMGIQATGNYGSDDLIIRDKKPIIGDENGESDDIQRPILVKRSAPTNNDRGCLNYSPKSSPITGKEVKGEPNKRKIGFDGVGNKENKRGSIEEHERVHVVETVVTVIVKDINDNSPVFPNTTLYGEVQENGPIDLPVTVVSAWDADDNSEGTNALLKYSIIDNVKDESTGQNIFAIHPDTGRITTTVCCLDRETTPEYRFFVVAQDGGGLSGTGRVVVRLADVNDNSPRLARDLWDVEVNETWGGDPAPNNNTLIQFSTLDHDTSNYFFYRVVEGSGWGWQYFDMRTSGNIGELYVKSPLDYEDPSHRRGFRFMVQVTDRVSRNYLFCFYIFTLHVGSLNLTGNLRASLLNSFLLYIFLPP
ncbi:Cadherin, partial [Halocaridina rubra]